MEFWRLWVFEAERGRDDGAFMNVWLRIFDNAFRRESECREKEEACKAKG